MKINKVKGTLDLFEREIQKYRYIERIAQTVSSTFGFQELMTPMIEATEVFSRGVGEGTDIVNKEMYTFMDRSDRSITLRPEGTAAITRAYVENKLYVTNGVHKYCYFGPMFRYERPQAGRLRQFTQFGIEALGPESPYLDADIIHMGNAFLQALGITKVKALVNTIGSKCGRANYETVLREYFSNHIADMCDDCKIRLLKNPLRILDCKVDGQSKIMQNAPKIKDYLSIDDKEYFQAVLHTLEALGVDYVESDQLVRGLDYYTNTVFEFIYDDPTSPLNGLALIAGGRYNGLATELGGPETNAIGFACGVERLMMVLDELGLFHSETSSADVVVITIGEAVKLEGLRLTNYLRQNGLRAEMDYTSHQLKAQFKLAERTNAAKIIIIGEDEVKHDILKIKDTIRKMEMELSVSELINYFGWKGEPYAYKK